MLKAVRLFFKPGLGRLAMKLAIDPEWSSLAKLMKIIGYGEVYNLVIKGGAPVAGTEVHYELRRILHAETKPCSRTSSQDSTRKGAFLRLVGYCESIGEGVIDVIEVQDGLPARIKHRKQTIL